MNESIPFGRRKFLGLSLVATAAVSAFGPASLLEAKEKEVSPVEDLMREHGALNRVLLIYEEGGRRIQARKELDPEILHQAAAIVRDFIEGYHEKLEEEHLFPRLEKAGKLTGLCHTLKTQHEAGRKVTQEILSRTQGAWGDADKTKTETAMSAFVRMYRPHEAFEDTVLFPVFKEILPGKEYEELGETFEEREHKLFGKDGFEQVVKKIAGLEQKFGIHDLSLFTPKT